MTTLALSLDVMLFELRRSLTFGRMAAWGILILFPVALFTTLNILMRVNMGPEAYASPDVFQALGVTLYFLIPEVCCLLGLLLWATPAVSTEIEGQTWVYLALRKAGRKSVLLGKYLTSLVWTFSTALISITICCCVVGPSVSWELAMVLWAIAALSCISHGALFILIGTLFYRRSIVTAVLYTVVVELGISFVPAVINKATINFRLRGLMAEWMGWENARSQFENVLGTDPAWQHLLALLLIAVLCLGVSLYRVETTEYPTQQEG
ncbi:MAG: hypothetical protein AAF664_03515 [Planctomycetota bacterium]